MQILIVGAGIGGLSAALVLAQHGHKVTILEAAAALAEVGAGVQLTPNTTKWLWSWGCKSEILAMSALPESFNVIDGYDGRLLGSVSFQEFEEKYGGPYLVIHRAEIHKVLHNHAIAAGVQLLLNKRVERYFPDEGRVLLTDGTQHSADLVVAVDGINSLSRQYLRDDISAGNSDKGLIRSGWAAYRLVANVADIASDDVNRELATAHRCNCVTGDDCSVMTYKVMGSNKINIVLSHLDNVETTEWTQEQFREEITRLFADFGSRTKRLLARAMSNPECQITNWPIEMVPTLLRWSSSSGKLVVMGDAAHAMPYFLSMGVSLATEDAAAPTECLKLMQSSQGTVTLAEAMQLFADVRKPRAELVRDASLHAGKVLHIPRGEAREARDMLLRDNGGSSRYRADMPLEEVTGLARSNRYGIIDDTLRDWCYGYDVVVDVRDRWQERFYPAGTSS